MELKLRMPRKSGLVCFLVVAECVLERTSDLRVGGSNPSGRASEIKGLRRFRYHAVQKIEIPGALGSSI
jgi:hypothetical protein